MDLKTEKLTYMEHENDVVFKSHEQLRYPDDILMLQLTFMVFVAPNLR